MYLTPANYLSLATTPSAASRIVNFASYSDTKLLHQLLPSVLTKLSRSKELTLANRVDKITTKDRLKERVKNRTESPSVPAPPEFTNPLQLKRFTDINAKELVYLQTIGVKVDPNAIPLPSHLDPYTLQLLGNYKALPN